VGKDESENQILRTVGKPPTFNFAPKEHWELGKNLGMLDIERAAKVSGSRFAYLKGDLALLEFALIQHALSILTNRTTLQEILNLAGLDLPATPFTPVIPPALIRPTFLEQMARLEPKEERYYLQDDDLYLIGSAEHTLGAMHADEILDEGSLPLRYAGFSSAFRREAGSHGKDVHGILRVHQFDKLELECFTVPEQSVAEQDFLVAIQEHLLQSLDLPYRVVLMCTGDMGAPDARQIDIETWFPGQQRYRETHTADLVTDYQARRLRTKVRRTSPTGRQASGEKVYVHMNDATAFAVGRTLAAILENFQQADGRVRVPAALRAALGGREFLGNIS
jgi:seryl-tRNA synthetase